MSRVGLGTWLLPVHKATFLAEDEKFTNEEVLPAVNVFSLHLVKILGWKYISLNISVGCFWSLFWNREAHGWLAGDYLKGLGLQWLGVVILEMLEMCVKLHVFWVCNEKQAFRGRKNGNRRQFIYYVDKNAEIREKWEFLKCITY